MDNTFCGERPPEGTWVEEEEATAYVELDVFQDAGNRAPSYAGLSNATYDADLWRILETSGGGVPPKRSSK